MDARREAKKIGELLLERGLITRGQLEQALEAQRTTKEFLGAILVRMGFIKSDALLAALSDQFGLPHERLTIERIDWRIVGQFPPSALSEGGCFPIRADESSVTVAVANPLNAWSLSAMEQAAGFRQVKVVLVLEEELRAVHQHYRRQSVQGLGAKLHDERKTQ